MDAQTDLSLRWAHRSFCWFCHAPFHILSTEETSQQELLLKANREIDAEIVEIDAKLKRLKQKRIDNIKEVEVSQARVDMEKSNVEDIRWKLQTLEKALVELNS